MGTLGKRAGVWAGASAAALLLITGCPKSGEGPVGPSPQPSTPPSTALTATASPLPPKVPEFERFRKERVQALRDAEATRMSIRRGFGFEDDTTMCVTPPPPSALDVNRSLFVHDVATLGGPTGPFELKKVLQLLANQANSAGASGTTPESLFTSLWKNEEAPACSSGINGYPIQCPRNEATQVATPATAAAQLALYQPIALVNRLDLADEGWRSCGEHRIIYGRTDASTLHRNFIIFEAVLPNPKPGCRSACRPVMEHWADLTGLPAAAAQTKLKELFIDGLSGFRPVVQLDHYSAFGVSSGYGKSRGGQIRTNQFLDDSPWLLREFNTLLDCSSSPCNVSLVPAMVKVNPFGNLWSENVAGDAADPFHTLAAQFQADMLAVSGGGAVPDAIVSLSQVEFEKVGYAVDLDFDAGDSDAQNGLATNGVDHYLNEFNLAPPGSGGFRDQFSAAVTGGLTPAQTINRALAQSCAGCHEPGTFGLDAPNSIGPAQLFDGTPINSWPASLRFVHVDDRAAGGLFAVSPALANAFLPFRKHNLESELAKEDCLCKRTFVTRPDRAQLLDKQKQLLDRLRPKLEVERSRLPRPPAAGAAPMSAAERRKFARTVRTLTDSFERELGVAVQGPLEPLALDKRPQAQKLDIPPGLAADPKKLADARRAAVIRQLKTEPPRRTVTGHFRVH